VDIRKLLLAAGGAASLMLVAPGTVATASTHPSYAAEASSYQNSVISSAMARAPAGVRVSPTQVQWDNYAVVLTVPATAGASTLSPAVADTCPAPIIGYRWSCVYNAYNFGGERLQFKDAGPYQDLYYYGGLLWETLSWSNTRGQRAWLNQNPNHDAAGYALCMSGNSHAGVNDGLAKDDEWIYLSSNTAAC
jgi:hypothetical protein